MLIVEKKKLLFIKTPNQKHIPLIIEAAGDNCFLSFGIKPLDL